MRTQRQLFGKTPLVSKMVFEVRYDHGYTYLDRCGRTVNRILRSYPDWFVANMDPNPQNCPLVNAANHCKFNFSALKLDMSLEKTSRALDDKHIETFFEEVKNLPEMVFEELGVDEFTRIGFRTWFMFGGESTAEVEEWLGKLNCCQIQPHFLDSFGGKLEATSLAIVLAADDRRFRISINNVERSLPVEVGESNVLNVPSHLLPEGQREHLLKQMEQKKILTENPAFAAMIDIDAFQENPGTVDPRDFAESSYRISSQALFNLEKTG